MTTLPVYTFVVQTRAAAVRTRLIHIATVLALTAILLIIPSPFRQTTRTVVHVNTHRAPVHIIDHPQPAF